MTVRYRLSPPCRLGSEGVGHGVLAYGQFLDAIDALDRYVLHAWSARDVANGTIAAVSSLFVTLGAWTDDFRHMLRVPAPMELPTLFQSFDELSSHESGQSSAADRIISIGNWINTFQEVTGDRPPEGSRASHGLCVCSRPAVRSRD